MSQAVRDEAEHQNMGIVHAWTWDRYTNWPELAIMQM